MVDSSRIHTFGFTYEEVEDIVSQWNSDYQVTYEGAIVRAVCGKDIIDFAEILSKMRPELNISPNAVSIYCEVGYIYSRRGIDVIVIDGIQEEYDNE